MGLRIKLFVLLLILSSFGFSFKISEPIDIFKDLSLKKKIKARINYDDNPNQKDFFISIKPEKCIPVGSLEVLSGIWTGTYDLSQQSVFWVNPNLENLKVFKLIDFRPYTIYLKFDLNNLGKVYKLVIDQNDISYSSVNVELADDKQINYWTKANSSSWLEIVRGKIFRLNNNELFTIFQTTIYEKKIPIYALQGEVVLKKQLDE